MMTFLQPLLLFGLPLIALPIIIHLINQRRYQSIRWAAMIFLLAANRMSRGYARLRQWLILLFRTLAIAALIFAVSRPLAGGWLGRTGGGRPDTTIVLLDRSPSMRQQSTGSPVSKLQSGRHQLARSLPVLGSGRWLLIESTTNAAREIESPDELLKLTSVEPASTTADVPAMLEAARDYIRANRTGRTEIWICSDLRQSDWNAESARWQALRDSILELPQSVRINLLAYADAASGNIAVQVTSVRRRQTTENAELLISLKLIRDGAGESSLSLPIQFDIEGARSELTVEMNGPLFELKDHHIPIERTRERGWCRVSIPADSNPADNEFFIAFDRPQPRRTLIVTDDPQGVVALQLAASISPDPAITSSAEVISREQLPTAEWDGLSLVLWQAPLPDADDAAKVEAFIRRGGRVLFLPPKSPGGAAFLGVRWKDWIEVANDSPIETWRGDQDLLANTQSGAALPVGRLQVRRFCGLDGELTPLVSLSGGRPLLARLPTNRGGAYFCGTTTDPRDSSLASNGVVLYVLVQRAIAAGASALGQTRQIVAGDAALEQPQSWSRVAGTSDAISTEFQHHAGIYSTGDKLFAVNRSTAEDQTGVLGDESVAELFRGLDFTRVDDRAGSLIGLIQEIWRPFLIVMLLALLVEAALCLPRRSKPEPELQARIGLSATTSNSERSVPSMA